MTEDPKPGTEQESGNQPDPGPGRGDDSLELSEDRKGMVDMPMFAAGAEVDPQMGGLPAAEGGAEPQSGATGASDSVESSPPNVSADNRE